MILIMIEHRGVHLIQISLSPPEVDVVNFVDEFDFGAPSPLARSDALAVS